MLKKIAIGFGLLVLIAIVLGCGKYSPLRPFKGRAARKDVNEKHAAADIEGDQLFQSLISSLLQLGIMGEKVAESKADTCFIESSDRGFLVTLGWEQFCQLDYVVGYTALLSREETLTRLQTLKKTDSTISPIRHFDGDACRLAYSSPSFAVNYVPAGPISDHWDCRIPDLLNGITLRDVGPRQASTKFDYTFDPAAIDQNVDLLWLTYTYLYYREDVGCRGLRCREPARSTPIQAD